MAPSFGSPTSFQSSGGDDNRSSDDSNNNNNNNNNNGDFGKGSSDSGSGSNLPKNSSPSSPPFKVITREVTLTRISTAVQTATVVLSSSSGSNPITGIPTTTAHSSTTTSSVTSSFSTLTPLSSSTGFTSPSNSSAQDGSPSPDTTPLRMKKSLPLVSIVLGCLFFITLCFVIYVLYIRKPGSPSRFANLFRRRHTPAASTIASFEPKEFRDFPRNPNFRRSARSFVVLPEFYLASNQAETENSRATFSPSRGKALLALNAPSYDGNSYKSRDSYSQGHRVASSEIQFPELPPSRTISALDEYPFEHSATDIAPISIDGRPTEDRSSRFPQSVQDMAVE